MTDRNYTCVANAMQRPKTKRLTTQEFIERSKSVHFDKYDYSKVEYINNRTKVKIFCKTCNEYFEQTPDRHMKGVGCWKCGVKTRSNNRRWDKELFIKKANDVHGIGTYNYSLVEYKSSMQKVKIYCNKHKFCFEQKVNSHIQGQGCPKCAGKLVTQNDFIAKCKELHGEKYDYSKTIYEKSNKKVVVTCKKHGDFKILPGNHGISGQGCKHCSVEASSERYKKSYDEFLQQATARHGDKYEYHDDGYTNSHGKVNIYCEIHGWFRQTAISHINGCGCPGCAKDLSGYNRTRFIRLCNKNNQGIGLLYVIECSLADEVFYKIGITSQTLKKRYSNPGKMPYTIKSVYSINGSGDLIYNLETQIHRLLRDCHYSPNKPFKGSVYECFSKIPKDVEKLLKSLEASQQLQLIT